MRGDAGAAFSDPLSFFSLEPFLGTGDLDAEERGDFEEPFPSPSM